MNASDPSISKRTLSPALAIGNIFLPFIFFWFLLRPGYSAALRGVAGIWLAVVALMVFTPGEDASDKISATTVSAPKAPERVLTPEEKEAAEKAAAEKRLAEEAEAAKKRFAGDTSSVDMVQVRYDENVQRLKKYYGTVERMETINRDSLTLIAVGVAYGEPGVNKEEAALAKRAKSLLPKLQTQSRLMYASAMEEIFMKAGMNATVSVTGPSKKTLRIKYALMSQALVYKFQNEIKIAKQAKDAGFEKLIYTDGLQGSYGESWSLDL